MRTESWLRGGLALSLALASAMALGACGEQAGSQASGVARTTATAPAAPPADQGGLVASATPAVAGDACSDAEVAPVQQATLPRPFSADSPWNTPVDARATDPRSDDWILRASKRVGVAGSERRAADRRAPDLRLYVNTCAWTPVIVGADGGQTVRIVCRQRNCGPVADEVKTLRVPAHIGPLPAFDGWYSVIDESAGVGYDMWRARRTGDVISYQFIKRWQLDGPGFSPPATDNPVAAVSARGSGLPLFAGVIAPEELRRGRIEHALAISVPGAAQRVFVAPASVTNGVNVTASLPEGARLRLRSTFIARSPRPAASRRSVEAILTALRTYGAIVVDRSSTPTLYARRGTGYGALLRGDELQDVRLSDLEVVQSGALLRYPPAGAASKAARG